MEQNDQHPCPTNIYEVESFTRWLVNIFWCVTCLAKSSSIWINSADIYAPIFWVQCVSFLICAQTSFVTIVHRLTYLKTTAVDVLGNYSRADSIQKEQFTNRIGILQSPTKWKDTTANSSRKKENNSEQKIEFKYKCVGNLSTAK